MNTTDATVESNIELVRDYTRRVFNEHNPELAAEFVTPDVKWHGGTLGSIEGSDNLIALLRSFIGALPDLDAQEQDLVADERVGAQDRVPQTARVALPDEVHVGQLGRPPDRGQSLAVALPLQRRLELGGPVEVVGVAFAEALTPAVLVKPEMDRPMSRRRLRSSWTSSTCTTTSASSSRPSRCSTRQV